MEMHNKSVVTTKNTVTTVTTVTKSIKPEVRGTTDFYGGAFPPSKTSPLYSLTTLTIFRFGRAGRDR